MNEGSGLGILPCHWKNSSSLTVDLLGFFIVPAVMLSSRLQGFFVPSKISIFFLFSSILLRNTRSSLSLRSLSANFARFSFDGSHLLRKIRRTASALILNLLASTGVENVALSNVCNERSPSMASRDSLRFGFQPSGKSLFILSRCRCHSSGVLVVSARMRRGRGNSSSLKSSGEGSAWTSDGGGTWPSSRQFRRRGTI